jgi:hypothetical protein
MEELSQLRADVDCGAHPVYVPTLAPPCKAWLGTFQGSFGWEETRGLAGNFNLSFEQNFKAIESGDISARVPTNYYLHFPSFPYRQSSTIIRLVSWILNSAGWRSAI